MLQELLKKKKPNKDMDPVHKSAKMSVLKDIRDMAANDMGGDLKDMKKVTVASPDEEGLKMGLDKAKDLVDEHKDDAEDAADDGDDEVAEGEGSEEGKPGAEKILEQEIDHEASEGDLSDEEIDELIALLESKKAKK